MEHASELSLNEMPLYDHRKDWTDGHIMVRFVGFDTDTGEITFRVTEEDAPVGLYYIWIIYGPDSGPPKGPPSQMSFTYDGAHPKRLELMTNLVVKTSFRDDPVRGIKVKKIHD